jgi:hypothetical protein
MANVDLDLFGLVLPHRVNVELWDLNAPTAHERSRPLLSIGLQHMVSWGSFDFCNQLASLLVERGTQVSVVEEQVRWHTYQRRCFA